LEGQLEAQKRMMADNLERARFKKEQQLEIEKKEEEVKRARIAERLAVLGEVSKTKTSEKSPSSVLEPSTQKADAALVPAQSQPKHAHISLISSGSALDDLEGIIPEAITDSAEDSKDIIDGEGQRYPVPAPTDTSAQFSSADRATCSVSAIEDSQKQLILYPQHPPFVNAISMIPATVFWMTAAPIVKYTNVAFDLLIDKLRDTYL
jgi:hypothetical protein